MRVLLTGATGLVGSNLCRLLRQRGDDVVAVVRPTAETAALAQLGVELVAGDVTKRAAFLEATARAARGQDVLLVVPGGVYGSAPVVERSLAPTSFNRALQSALRGRLSRFVRFPIPWVLADDVAACTLLALERG